MQRTAEPTRIQFTSAPTASGVPIFPNAQVSGKSISDGQATDDSEAANGAEARRRALHEDAVERPAKTRGEGDAEADQRHVIRLKAGLKPENPDCAGQAEKGPDLELPLPDDPAFLGKENEREERRDDDRGANENGVNARPHVVERRDLGHLMDHVRNGRQQADSNHVPTQRGPAAPEAIEREWQDGEEGDRVAVEVLRKRLVIPQEVN